MSTPYDQPSPGHKTALEQIAASRAEVYELLKEINAMSFPDDGPDHASLVSVQDAPTRHTLATSSLSNYLLQLRPYRGQTDSWTAPMSDIILPKKFETMPAGDSDVPRYWKIQNSPVVEIDTLSDVIDSAGKRVVYSAKEYGEGNFGREAKRYLMTLTKPQIRSILGRADDVAADMGFLGEITENDTTDTEGF